MTLSPRHGRRILNKPFNQALHKWHISVLLVSQMCFITFFLLITMSRFASSAPSDRPATSNNSYWPYWPLRYHFSQWLHKEFVDDYRPLSVCDSSERTDKCQTMSSNSSDSNHSNPNSEQNKSVFRNVSAITMSSNGSVLKTSQTIISNEMTTDSAAVGVGAGASDGTIAIATSPTPKLTDSVLVPNNQCLFLDGKSAKSICDSSQGVPRLRLLDQFHLKHCHRYPLVSVLSYEAWQRLLHSSNSQQCEHILSELVMIDSIVDQLICEYDSLLERYDCQNGFSVIWTCDDCRKVYRDWVCSMLIPFHMNGVPIKPCRSFCERVEQRCPHLHPYGKGQYAGEPVFLCIDPNIPFNPSITPITPYADPYLCYDSCHLLSDQNTISADPHPDSRVDERIDCISNSELLHNNMATNSSTTSATQTESSAANH